MLMLRMIPRQSYLKSTGKVYVVQELVMKMHSIGINVILQIAPDLQKGYT